MKLPPCLFATFTLTTVSLIPCSSVFAGTPQTVLTIENHQNLVTVKDDSGKWLFAQVITTPNLKISEVSLGQNSTRITLQGASGKLLWTKDLNTPIRSFSLSGEWIDKFRTVAKPAFEGLESSDIKMFPENNSDNKTRPEAVPIRCEIFVGPDDNLISFNVSAGKLFATITPLKNGLSVQADNRTLVILQPPAAPAVAQASTP